MHLANNLISSASLKEFAVLKSLELLDLANNKLSADLEIWNKSFMVSALSKLHTINLICNQ